MVVEEGEESDGEELVGEMSDGEELVGEIGDTGGEKEDRRESPGGGRGSGAEHPWMSKKSKSYTPSIVFLFINIIECPPSKHLFFNIQGKSVSTTEGGAVLGAIVVPLNTVVS